MTDQQAAQTDTGAASLVGQDDIRKLRGLEALGFIASDVVDRIAQTCGYTALRATTPATASAREEAVMQDWRLGNLTPLGVANHLRRAGFNARYAVDKANELRAAPPVQPACGEIAELQRFLGSGWQLLDPLQQLQIRERAIIALFRLASSGDGSREEKK